MAGRKNFKCKFNPYVTSENRDSVVKSLIAQFQGYDADPEVTVLDDGLIISINTSSDLTPSGIREKLLWNYFIQTVSTQEAIRSIQILRLPKTTSWNKESRELGEGSVGGFGPEVGPERRTGVDEVMWIDGEPMEHTEYKIDMGDRPDGPPLRRKGSRTRSFNSRYADPTETDMIPFAHNEVGEPVNPEVLSDITDLKKDTAEPVSKIMPIGSVHTALGGGDAEGGFFGDPAAVAHEYGIDVTAGPPKTTGPTRRLKDDPDPGTAPAINFGSFYDEQPVGNVQDDSFATKSRAKSAPLQFGIGASTEKHEGLEVVNDSAEMGPRPTLGNGSDVEGWFSNEATTGSVHFGINEYYTYESDIDDSEL